MNQPTPRTIRLALGLLAWGCCGGGPLHAEDATLPGEPASPYPTLHHLAVEWPFRGDANANGIVTVRYRRSGEAAWREAMPLMRIAAGRWSDVRPGAPSRRDHSWASRHSGSIFDLQPDTGYEIALQLTDPDGGSATRTLQVRTRPVPRAASGARIVRANPKTLPAVAAQAQAGDIVLLAPGNYGYFAVPCDGAPGRPLVFRAEPGGRFEGSQNHGAALFEGISLQNRKHVYLEELYSSDTIDLFNADSCVVRRCRIQAVFGIVSAWSGNLGRKWAPRVGDRLKPPATPDLWGAADEDPLPPGATPRPHATNCYIADNVVVGMTRWASEAMGVFGENLGEGIEITGPGNVICHNRVSGFRDCISTLEDRFAVRQMCIDIYNNDVSCGPDDGIEADFGMGNCRILRNRITNCFIGISSQPSLGGPHYIIRNVMYNLIHSSYKLMRTSSGNIVLHNTVVKTGDGAVCQTSDAKDLFSNSTFLNNLSLGGGGLGVFSRQRYRNGTGLVAYFPTADNSCRFDYNGYGAEGMPFRGRIGQVSFDGLAGLRALTTEKHGVRVTLAVFAQPVGLPDPALREWDPPDLRLAAESAAVDAGLALPNINEGYAGRAPDLGAYEVGRDLPIYGPRPPGVDE